MPLYLRLCRYLSRFLKPGGWLCLSLVLGMSATGSLAAQRALLVGVSELVNQPPSLWLQAPRNDVILMRDTLLRHGFAAADISILADGVAGAALPEAALVHEALARLLKVSQSGDFVMLYFSGHGTRMRDSAKLYQEPDGLAENFLTRDTRSMAGALSTGGAAGSAGPALASGIRDIEFDSWVKAFLAKNVFVWSVYDTCSAASMTRGVEKKDTSNAGNDEVRFRGVSPSQLLASNVPLAQSAPVPQTKETVSRARYVAFFASESHQVTPELRLPRKGRDARPHGLLTWAVAESLNRKPETWRDLYLGVLNLYPPVIDELERRFPNREMPSPVAEGSLDFKLFSNQELSASTRPVWPALRTGAVLTVKNGLLDGLEAQQQVRVLAVQSNGTTLAAEGRLKMVELNTARLDVPPGLAALSNASNWTVTPMSEPISVSLKVRSDTALPSGLSLDYPVSVKRVTDGAFDVQVSAAAPSGYRVEVMQSSIAGAVPSSVHTLADASALQQRLQAVAQWKWLGQMTDLAKKTELDGFSAILEVTDGTRVVRSERMQATSALKPLGPTEQAHLVVRNTSGQSLDLLIAELDDRGKLRTLYPENSNESNRFERGTRQTPSFKRFPLSANAVKAGARLVVVAGLAQPHSQPRLFGVSVRDSVNDVQIRGQLTPDKERQVFASLLRWSDDASPEK
jgi:Caspase domain